MRRTWFAALGVAVLSTACVITPGEMVGAELSPAPGTRGVNVDASLVLTFDAEPQIGTSGLSEITDLATGDVVDRIDMSVPPSPLPTGRFPPNTNQEKIFALGRDSEMDAYQVNTIGGVDFHFFPVIVDGNTARLYPHNGALDYGHSYRVTVSPGVLDAGADFDGVAAADGWTFTVRADAPDISDGQIVVAADGSGDFSTVQGAVDFAPDASDPPLEIFIRDGDYEEIVMLNGKSGLTLRGESRDGVRVHYRNNSAFNPPRGGASRRPAFSVINASDIQLSDFTIENDFIGQAEALLVRGERIIIDNMQLNGSGDALTTYGSIYMRDSELVGDGDTILAYATLFCERCTIKSVGPFVWPRTPEGQHGNVFVDSTFIYLDEPLPWTVSEANPDGQKVPGVLARLPFNGPSDGPRNERSNFPFAEMVLINARMDGVPPEGWGTVEPDSLEFSWENIQFWEFGTTDLSGQPLDLSQRSAPGRVLSLPTGASLIGNYSTPEFVLGWTPEVRDPVKP